MIGDPSAAEDIAQESFLAAVRALDRFDRRRPFGPWLHRITVNRAIDFARARALRAESALPAARRRGAGARRDLRQLLAALRELGPEHRAVVVLRYVLEYSPGEIGEILGLPRGNRELAAAARRSTGCGRRSRRTTRERRSRARPGAAGGRRSRTRPRPRSAPGRSSAPRTRSARRCDRRRPGRRLALAVAAGLALLAIGLSPAGAKVGDADRGRARDRRRGREPDPALAAGGGRAAGRVRAGPVDRPRGRLEAAARRLRRGDLVAARDLRRGRRAAASSPRSTRSATCAGRSRRRAWCGTRAGRGDAVDTRIAYRSGDDLRVIAGDGNPESDRLIARDVAPVAPAWRPVGVREARAARRVRAHLPRRRRRRAAVDAETGERVPVLRRGPGAPSSRSARVARPTAPASRRVGARAEATSWS